MPKYKLLINKMESISCEVSAKDEQSAKLAYYEGKAKHLRTYDTDTMIVEVIKI